MTGITRISKCDHAEPCDSVESCVNRELTAERDEARAQLAEVKSMCERAESHAQTAINASHDLLEKLEQVTKERDDMRNACVAVAKVSQDKLSSAQLEIVELRRVLGDLHHDIILDQGTDPELSKILSSYTVAQPLIDAIAKATEVLVSGSEACTALEPWTK